MGESGWAAKRLLIALAHPDDESFGMAGTIAHYVEAGVSVYVICATNGDVGVADPRFLEQYASMAELRLSELQCAAETLGLAGLYTFGYRDSGMAGSPDNGHPDSLVSAPVTEVADRIVQVIRDVQPQVVVTFDPYGSYGHPDHIKMYEATTLAFEICRNGLKLADTTTSIDFNCPQKLYYRTRNRTYYRIIVNLLPLFGVDPGQMGKNKDINLRAIISHTYPIHARIHTRHVSEQAERARLCHASQLGGLAQPSLLQQMQRLFVNPTVETYMRAYPPVKDRRVSERDLFAGIFQSSH